MKLAEKHAVRFAKTMTCLNIGCPLTRAAFSKGLRLKSNFLSMR
jgi:hypothetical protein